MYLVKALRLFVGTNAERTAAGLGAFLPGDEYHETDTDNTFQNDGMAWIQKNTLTTPAGTDGQLQYNNGGAFGGAGIYWNDVQNQLLVNNSTPAFAGTVAEFHDAATAATIAIVNDTASADANIAATSYYLKNTSELQTAFGYFSVGSVTRTNGAEDGYFDISVMRGGTLTSMLDIRPSVITLNPGAGDTDLRISGNGVTNGVYWDAGNSRLGIRTNTPSGSIEIANPGASEVALAIGRASGTASIIAGGDASVIVDSNGGVAGLNFYAADNVVLAFGGGNVGVKDAAPSQALAISGSQYFGSTLIDKISLYADRIGTSTMYGFGVEGNALYSKSPAMHRWYVNTNADGGTSDKMELSGTVLTLSVPVRLPNLTTTQQNALTGVNGLLIYNTTTNKFTGYAAGAWVALH